MRKIVLLEHVSLDGFAAGPDGEMDWINVEEELFDYVAHLTEDADAALFGRATYQMMAGYWPTAGDAPDADRHAVQHSHWVNAATKYVTSKTLTEAPWGDRNNVELLRGDLGEELKQIKQGPGQNLLLIGSISIAQQCARLGLIDDYWINVNPIVLGDGRPLFANIGDRLKLKLVDSRIFDSGVLGLHYQPA